jgi:hypothetical protein
MRSLIKNRTRKYVLVWTGSGEVTALCEYCNECGCFWDLSSSGMLCSIGLVVTDVSVQPMWDVRPHRLVVTDVSGQPMGPIFKGQGVVILWLLDIWMRVRGSLKSSVFNYKHTLRNFPEERSSRLHCRRRMKSRMSIAFWNYSFRGPCIVSC